MIKFTVEQAMEAWNHLVPVAQMLGITKVSPRTHEGYWDKMDARVQIRTSTFESVKRGQEAVRMLAETIAQSLR
jgi:hypothetical protein